MGVSLTFTELFHISPKDLFPITWVLVSFLSQLIYILCFTKGKTAAALLWGLTAYTRSSIDFGLPKPSYSHILQNIVGHSDFWNVFWAYYSSLKENLC